MLESKCGTSVSEVKGAGEGTDADKDAGDGVDMAVGDGADEGAVMTGYVLGLQMPESGCPSQSNQCHRTMCTHCITSPFAALLSPLLLYARSQDGPFY